MRQWALAAVCASALLALSAGTARADCPDADGDCPAGEMTVPTIDGDGDPIPYVEEITAPAEGTALTFSDAD